MSAALLATVRHGDRVTIRTPQGQTITGRANGLLITRGSHCVLDAGGKHGRPVIATASNIVSVSVRKVPA